MMSYTRRKTDLITLKEGCHIEGVLYAITPGKYGQNFIFHLPGGSLGCLYGAAQLEQNIFHTDIGSRFWIKYNGKVKTNDGNEFKSYDIGVDDGKSEHSQEANKKEEQTSARTPF